MLPLPPQPADVPWPTVDWPVGDANPAVDALVDEVFTDTEQFGTTYAALVVVGGRVIAERYGGEITHWDGPDEPVTPDTKLLSWSMAKSVLHAAVGILVGEKLLDPDAPAPVPAWAGDERSAITLQQLLEMRDGLKWAEDYVDANVSDVIEMLFGAGTADVAGYATARPLAHEPGKVFNYSSGTSNIVARIVGDAVGDTAAFLRQRVFDPIGMTSAEARVDDAGTFVGSSFVYATARDWARFGLLHLRDGEWDATRVLPEGWVDHGRTLRSRDDDGSGYGAHWWVVDDDLGTFRASGYEGQMVAICPALDALVVRLGNTPEAIKPNLFAWRDRALDAVRQRSGDVPATP